MDTLRQLAGDVSEFLTNRAAMVANTPGYQPTATTGRERLEQIASRSPEELRALYDDVWNNPFFGPLVSAIKASNLPIDEISRMLRAKQVNFNERDFYHATHTDVPHIDLSKAGSQASFGERGQRAFFLTDKPPVADTYLGGGWVRADSPDAVAAGLPDSGGNVARYYSRGANVMPLRVRDVQDFEWWQFGGGPYDRELVSDAIAQARKAKAPGVVFQQMADPGLMSLGRPEASNILAILDPRVVRSRFAMFDPARINSKNLLASLAPLFAAAGIGAGAMGVDAEATEQ
jgi:hypothetical protein